MKLCIVSEKFMPYRGAAYEKLAEQKSVDLHVYFLSSWGFEENFDETMGVKYSWNSKVLSKFSYKIFGKRVTSSTYTGADRRVIERMIPFIGSVIFYFRLFFSKVSLNAVRDIRKEKFDYVMIENYSSAGSLFAALSAKSIKSKLIFRGEAVIRHNNIIIRHIKKLYLKSFFKIFDHFLYASKANLEYLVHYGVSPEKCVFFPSAVDAKIFDANRFSAAERREIRVSLRNKLGIGNSKFVIIGVGRLVPRKNWDHIIRSLALVETDYHLLLVGDGPERRILADYLSEHNVENVTLCGFESQENLYKYYLTADVAVQCSSYDPSPKFLNEALGFSLPIVVSSQVGTSSDLCSHGSNGYVYKYGDLIALAHYLDQIPNRLDELSREAGLTSQIWNLDSGVENLMEILK